MKPLIVLKIGTNVLTLKNGRINFNLIHDVVEQIAKLKDQYRFLLVSSGAVGTGKSLINPVRVNDPILKKQIFAAVGQGKLYSIYSQAFSEKGIVTAQALLTKHDFRVPAHYTSIKNTLNSLLEIDVLPIINENDVVNADESTFGDNDQLSAITACLLMADKFVILTDIGGFYTSDPKIDKSATLLREVKQISSELVEFCRNSISTGGTGGMYSKLRAITTATEAGIPAVIACGHKENIISGILSNNFEGTYFNPVEGKKKKIKNIWIKNLAETKGYVVVDSGAEQALKNDKSLLAVGVTEARQIFGKGDVIIVKNKEGVPIAVGLTGLGSSEFSELKSTGEKLRGKIFIHKNHLYLL